MGKFISVKKFSVIYMSSIFIIVFLANLIFSSDKFGYSLLIALGASFVFSLFIVPVYNMINARVSFQETKNNQGKESSNVFIVENVHYKGGHIKYASKDDGFTSGTKGIITLSNSLINFSCLGVFNRIEWSMDIPLKKIIKEEISSNQDNRLSTAQEIGAMTATGGLIVNRKLNLLTIPYIDDKGIKQRPVFAFAQNKKNSCFMLNLYDKL